MTEELPDGISYELLSDEDMEAILNQEKEDEVT